MEIMNGRWDLSLCAPPPSHAMMAEQQEIFVSISSACKNILRESYSDDEPTGFLRSGSERKFAVE